LNHQGADRLDMSESRASTTAFQDVVRLQRSAKAHASLDRLAALAGALLRARAAQVSLLTDVQWIAASGGLAPPSGGPPTPLSDSLCKVTAGTDVPLVVPDARSDARVSALAPVVGGEVGSYLGVPLDSTSGSRVGALCVYGPDRREWTPADVAVLELLAQWAMSELELAALTDDLNEDRKRWQLAIDAAGIGSFDLDLATGRLASDARGKELLGFPPDVRDVRLETFLDRVPEEDAVRVARAIEEAVQAVGVYQTEHRVHAQGEPERWLRVRGRVLADRDGRAVRLLGSVQDATDEKQADARAVRVLESMSAAFVSLTPDWRISYVNAEAEKVLGVSRSELLDRDHWEAFPLTVGSEFETVYRRALATKQAEALEAFYGPPLNAWYEVRVLPSPDGLSIYFVDVTDRHIAQELIELTHEVSDRLTASLEVEDTLRHLAQLVVPKLADWSIVSVAGDDGDVLDVATWHADPALRGAAQRYAEHRAEGRDDAVVADVLSGTQPYVLERGATEKALELLRSDEAIEAIRGLAPESTVVMPLPAAGRRGLLSLARGAGRPSFSDEEIAVARTIAQRAGLALDNARLYTEQRTSAERLQQLADRLADANDRLQQAAEHESSVARALQDAMLTRLPEPDHLQMAARYLTASGSEKVGGDWYDAVVLPGGATFVTIGDVVGHDIEAAAVMGQLRNMLRVLAWDREEPPSVVVGRLDRANRELGIDTVATVLALRIEQPGDQRSSGLRTLRWTSAGHPAPVLIYADGTARLLSRSNDVLLGLDPRKPRRDHTEMAPAGSTLLLYTDGLIETNRRNLDAGQAQLLETVSRHHARPIEQFADAIIADMVGDAPADDVAVLVVRLLDDEGPVPAKREEREA